MPLHHVQPFLEESARGLVSQVVKAQAADACAAHRPPEGLFQSVWRELTEDAAAGRAGQPVKNRYRSTRERHAARVAILGDRQEGDAPLEVHVRPL
jgi:hypothetical protein